jgi:hypothetical protein
MNQDQQEWKKYDNAPIIESFVQRRKTDKGEFVIHKIVITDIKPVKYYDKMLSDEEVDA